MGQEDKWMCCRLSWCIACLLLIAPLLAAAQKHEPDIWGVAFGVRSAVIPYATEVDRVNDVVPLLYYDNNEYLFIRGLTAGIRFYSNEQLQFAAIGRYRFFDIPSDYQNQLQGNAVDVGLQFKYLFTPQLNADFEVLNDRHGRVHVNAVANYNLHAGDWELAPSARLRWKSDSFNHTYYGLNIDKPGSGFDVKIGLDARYHVASNFYLIGRASLTALEKDVRQSSVISRDVQSELFLGIAFFNDKKKQRGALLKSKPYVRVAHGWATPSNIGDILKFNSESDPYNNQLTSIFYGLPVSDTLLTLPLPVYVTPGVVYHHNSEVQGNFEEYVLALKIYYQINWPLRWRLGLAEGLSYASDISYIERTELEAKGYRPSNLLNYLDFSLDVNLGDIFNLVAMKQMWLGYSIHHRSGIFQASSAFGRIKGGSNYNTVYLQYHW